MDKERYEKTHQAGEKQRKPQCEAIFDADAAGLLFCAIGLFRVARPVRTSGHRGDGYHGGAAGW